VRRTDIVGGTRTHTRVAHYIIRNTACQRWRRLMTTMTMNIARFQSLLLLGTVYACLISILPYPVVAFLPNHALVEIKRATELAAASPTPIDAAGWPDRFPAKEHCSKCGLCETTFVSHVSEACAFIDEGMARMDALEVEVHGRGRDTTRLG